MINQTRQQTKYCLGLSSQSSRKGNNYNNSSYNNNGNNYYHYNNSNDDDEASIEKMRKEIEANQDNALSLCTEKVLLAQQAFDLVCFFSLFESRFLSSGKVPVFVSVVYPLVIFH